jgi:dTDP-4-dehydrorhamnose reductase
VRVIVTGVRGMLGQDLRPRLARAGFEVVGLDKNQLDITRWESVLRSFESILPDLAINCAAYTEVDRAESNLEIALAVNRDGARHLARICRRLGIPLIHLSTDYVFDGNSEQPYREDDTADPINFYGLSKWQGEEAIRKELPSHLIVRTSWLYGAHGHNFVKTILKLAREKEEIRVVADQSGCPTWTGDLAEAIISMAGRVQEYSNDINWGTYHFCGAGRTTWYGFAEAIVDEGRRRETLRAIRILPVSSSDYPTAARRPRWSVLDCQKVGLNFNITPRPWQQGLIGMIAELFY